MEKIKNTYEVLFVTDIAEGEETAKATVEKFRSLISEHGEIVAIDEWGKCRFAYPINDKTEGYYTLIYFRSDPSFTEELTRVFGITEGIMRYLILKVNEKKQQLNVSSPKEVIDFDAEESDDEIDDDEDVVKEDKAADGENTAEDSTEE
ncbi:MAG: 30S ribosomal protein S6 [Eubacteriales bacterium]|jgi:small subunit ribosomal protein S6|nr:30S ribosomal protein S6 [Clostridiales bacterium]